MDPRIVEETSAEEILDRQDNNGQETAYTDLSHHGALLEPATEVDRLRRRLDIYRHWSSKKSSLQLATAGFIYTGITDKVECQSCGIRLYNWQENEDPLQAHKKYAPDCEFMVKNFPNLKAPTQPRKVLTVKHPHYSDYETRLRSFDSWPLKCVAQKPEMMAKSGFFYLGSADRARCFHCGVTLRDWDTDDYPPCAHRQWSENCPFVQQLDVDRMKKEIEEMERVERLRIELECSLFINVHGDSLSTNNRSVQDPSPDRTQASATAERGEVDSSLEVLGRRHQRRSRQVIVEHTLVLPPRGVAEVAIRGDDSSTSCILRIEDSTRGGE